ncbi:unnamed protein product, partial [Vitis vinifera]
MSQNPQVRLTCEQALELQEGIVAFDPGNCHANVLSWYLAL